MFCISGLWVFYMLFAMSSLRDRTEGKGKGIGGIEKKEGERKEWRKDCIKKIMKGEGER